MTEQDILRKQVKLVKTEYDDIYYIDLAHYLNIKPHSFYNWQKKQYNLSKEKAAKLKEILDDLLSEE